MSLNEISGSFCSRVRTLVSSNGFAFSHIESPSKRWVVSHEARWWMRLYQVECRWLQSVVNKTSIDEIADYNITTMWSIDRSREWFVVVALLSSRFVSFGCSSPHHRHRHVYTLILTRIEWRRSLAFGWSTQFDTWPPSNRICPFALSQFVATCSGFILLLRDQPPYTRRRRRRRLPSDKLRKYANLTRWDLSFYYLPLFWFWFWFWFCVSPLQPQLNVEYSHA